MKQPSRKVLSKRLLKQKLDRSDSSIQRLVKNGILPRPFYIATRPYWFEDEVDTHTISTAVAQRDAEMAAA